MKVIKIQRKFIKNDNEENQNMQEQTGDMSGQTGNFGELPDEMLQGIGEMSDEELKLLLAKNPDLEELLK